MDKVTASALHHLTRLWNEEQKADGIRFLSIDPGYMDTPMHTAVARAAAPSTLKRPEDAARESGNCGTIRHV